MIKTERGLWLHHRLEKVPNKSGIQLEKKPGKLDNPTMKVASISSKAKH